MDVVMPRLSDSMEEGTIVAWLCQEGEEVRRGQPLVEIETDKATMVYEADSDGILHILAEPGDTIPLGQVIAQLNRPGVAQKATPEPVEPDNKQADDDLQELIQAERQAAHKAMADRDRRVISSPYARQKAQEQGLDISKVTGSGPQGRVVASDLEKPDPPAPAPRRDDGSADLLSRPTTRVERLIAARMQAGKEAPEFWASRKINLDRLVELRDDIKQQGERPASLNQLIMLAAARSAAANPRINSSWAGEEIVFHPQVNLGMAVATEDGLIVPVIKDAAALSLGEISLEVQRLTQAVHDGSITPEEMEGASLTVSSLGSMGVDRFQAILPPGHSAILAVGAMQTELSWKDGSAQPVQIVEVTLTVDHRTVYGAHAAQFLSDLSGMLENPLRLL